MQYYSDPAWANFVAVNFGSPPLNLMDDDWSHPAPLFLEAHLRFSRLYLIYLIAKCISFLQKKDESSKIFLNHNVWLWSSVCSIAQLVSGWHGFKSRPSLNLFFTVNFSAIGKIAAHLRGSCLNLILIHNSKETYFVTNSYRKVA